MPSIHKFIIIFALVFSALSAHAKLLDKIVAVVDDNIIMQSQLSRTQKILAIKKSISPLIYEKNNYNHAELLTIAVNKFLIRSKLTEIGYNVTDDQVESQIKSNEERLGVDRKSLMSFLKQQNTSFDEYFETLREAMEFSFFINRVISPSISISDQEIKNSYYKSNLKDTRLNFKYSLIDYAISKDLLPKVEKNQFENIVKEYRIKNILPETFSTMTSTPLDDIAEEGLADDLKKILKATDEGSFAGPILINGAHHLFFIAKKDLVETEAYLAQKDKIKNQLLEVAIKNETALWLEREKNKHYIKISI